MRLLILRILIRLFFKNQREIKKIPLAEELVKYQFRDAKETIEILKHNRTCMTLWHFETMSRDESNIVRGMALMCSILIDANVRAVKLKDVKDVSKRVCLWSKYKNIEKSNIWNKIIKAGRGSGDK